MPRRILIVSPYLPSPRAWGFGTRVFQLGRELATRHEVHLLSYVKAADASHAPLVGSAFAHTKLIAQEEDEGWKKRVAQAATLVAPRSHRASAAWSDEMQSALAKIWVEHRIDLVQVESSVLSSLRFPEPARVVLDEHNIEYELLERMSRSEGTALRRTFSGIEARKVRREETAFWRSAGGTVVTSDREAEIVAREVPGALVGVVPNGVDTGYFSPASTPVEKDTVVFTGAMNYRPNAEAVIFFVKDILPLILRKRPETKFVVVGRGVPPSVERLAGPQVRFTGEVDDVRPYAHSAAVVVVPLQMGSGTRLKVLEALAMGKPVVSTRLGAEGIPVGDGEDVLLADDPGDFAEKVVTLLGDRVLAGRLGESGRALVARDYSWQSVAGRLDRFHDMVVESG